MNLRISKALPVTLLAFPTSFGLDLTDTSVYFGAVDNAPYEEWTNRYGNKYDGSVFLQPGTDPANGAAIHWSVNSTHLWLSLAVRAVGWAGFGIAENGGMRGADMFLYEAETNQVIDAHVLDDLQPLTDDCNDWELVNTINEGGFIIVEVRRKLDTNDSQDRAISNDADLSIPPHRVIAAWGDSGQATHHGPNNRARGGIRFFGNQSGTELERFQRTMEQEAEGHFDLIASNHTIRNVDTEYALFCFTQQDVIDMGVPMMSELHVIGVEPIVENPKYVHHFIVTASELGNVTCNTNSEDDDEEDDDVFTGDDPEDDFAHLAYVWAPGEVALHLPPKVGQPLGAGGGFKAFVVEIHYNNPTLDAGVLDNSGVRLHYTSKKREFDLGIWQVGDPSVGLFGQAVGEGLSRHTFDCPATCSSLFFPRTVTVLREYLHMHGSGVKMYNSQIRNGAEIRRTEVDFWDFDQNGNFAPIQEPYEFNPGDGYKTECFFSGQGEVFGLSSSEEMCMSTIFYYPKVSLDGFSPLCGYGYAFLPECNAPHDEQLLVNITELERTFGVPSGACNSSDNASPTLTPIATLEPEPGSASPTLTPIATLEPKPTTSPVSVVTPSPVARPGIEDASAYFDDIDNNIYLDWLHHSVGNYERSLFLQGGNNPQHGAAVHWTVNSFHLSLALVVRASGWAGFGIGENGGMRGADMVLYEAATDRLTDAYVLDDLQPLTDSCNDWELVNSTDDGDFLIVEARRQLDTGDSQDRAIVDDAHLAIPPHRIMAAWGDTDKVTSHGPNNRVRGAVRFFGDQSGTELERFQKAMEFEAEGYFDLLAPKHTIRAAETEYALFCFTLQDLIELGVPMMSKLHTIGIESIVENPKYVHHYIVYASESGNVACSTDSESDDDGDDDVFSNEPEDEFGQLAYAWAPGEGPLHLPPNVGQPLGDGGFKAFLVEIHYNNPTLDTGVTDSSGVRFHYTSEKREYDLGVWQVGDPNVNLSGQSVGDGLFSHTFDCSGACSSILFPTKVTVLREYLHMHGSGVKMSNSQIRDGAEVRRAEVGFFDFDQSGTFAPVQEPYEFRPGDGYKTECIFNGQDEVFGLSSSEEMCIAFMFYYPKVSLDGYSPICGFGFDFFPQCDSPHQVRSLQDSSELERKFGEQSEKCGGSADVPSTSPSLEGSFTEEPTSSPTSSGACLSCFKAARLLLVIGVSLILLLEI